MQSAFEHYLQRLVHVVVASEYPPRFLRRCAVSCFNFLGRDLFLKFLIMLRFLKKNKVDEFDKQFKFLLKHKIVSRQSYYSVKRYFFQHHRKYQSYIDLFSEDDI